MKTGTLLVALLALTGACANAAVIFTENFDGGVLNTPRWVVPSGNATATNVHSVSPSYSAQLQGRNTWLYSRDFTALPTATTSEKIEVSFDVRFDAPLIYSRLVTLQTSAVNSAFAGIRASADGKFQLHNTDGTNIGDYQASTWYHVTLSLLLKERTYDVSISELGGAAVGSVSGVAFHNETAANFGTVYFYNDATAQTTFIDNVLIQSIPEPSLVSFLALAGTAAWGVRRRNLRLKGSLQ